MSPRFLGRCALKMRMCMQRWGCVKPNPKRCDESFRALLTKKTTCDYEKTKKSASKNIERWPSYGRFRTGPKRAFFAKNWKKQPFLDFERVGLKILNFSFQHLKDNFFPDFLRYFASIYLLGNISKKILKCHKWAVLLPLHCYYNTHCTYTGAYTAPTQFKAHLHEIQGDTLFYFIHICL